MNRLYGNIGVCLYIVTLLSGYSAMSLNRLEQRISMVEDQLDAEIKFRREDTKLVLSQLEEIKRNASLSKDTYGVNRQEDRMNQNGLESKDKTSLTKQLEGMHDRLNHALRAIRDEKELNSRIRRRVPAIESQLASYEVTMSMLEHYAVNASQDNKFVVSHIQDILELAIGHTEAIDKLEVVVSHLSEQDYNTSEVLTRDIRASVSNIDIAISNLNNKMDNTSEVLTRDIRASVSNIDIAISNLNKKMDNVLQSITTEKASSCLELYNSGDTTSGVYDIYPGKSNSPIRVFCDQETDGGGWTVFQRRVDDTVDFYRGWADYKSGFGNLKGNFWLGNEYLSFLVGTCCQELRVDLKDFDNNHRFAKYSAFSIGTEKDAYLLTVSGYSGDAGDSLIIHSNQKFSTKDIDNDKRTGNCAESFKGGWWYNNCHHGNLNGLYLSGKHLFSSQSASWYHWLGQAYSLKFAEMKFRSSLI